MSQPNEKINKIIQYLKNKKYKNAENVAFSFIKENPNDPSIWAILGGIYLSTKELHKALDACRNYIKILPNDPEGYNNLGYIFLQQDKLDEAKINYKKMINLDPNNAKGYLNLAIVLEKKKDFENAIKIYNQAISINPSYTQAYHNLALLLKETGEILEAEKISKIALSLNPTNVDIMNNLATSYFLQNKSQKAINILKKALSIKPKQSFLHNNKNYYLNFLDLFSKEIIFNEHVEFNNEFGYLTKHKASIVNIKKNKIEKINVGYVSGDFKQHSVSYFFEPLLKHHDTKKFNTFCYSNNTVIDNTTHRLMSYSKKWRNIYDKKDEEVYDMIQKDKIDILIDLSGHTRGNRLTVFAKKPAPIQITWLGYPNTTGLSSIDYRFTDKITDPVGKTEKYHSEKLYRLPNGFLCFMGDEDSRIKKEIPLIRNKFVTFGSFNNFAKISPSTVKIWSKILNSIPNSRLLLKTSKDNLNFNNFIKLFVKEGVEENKVQFLNRVPKYKDHLEFYNEIDIALDTFPYNGTTTTFEALWMGVPVITNLGDRHVSRVGASILTNFGLNIFISKNLDEYVDIAKKYSSKAIYLKDLRCNLREKLKKSLLCNGISFTKDIENAYNNIWNEFHEKETTKKNI